MRQQTDTSKGPKKSRSGEEEGQGPTESRRKLRQLEVTTSLWTEGPLLKVPPSQALTDWSEVCDQELCDAFVRGGLTAVKDLVAEPASEVGRRLQDKSKNIYKGLLVRRLEQLKVPEGGEWTRAKAQAMSRAILSRHGFPPQTLLAVYEILEISLTSKPLAKERVLKAADYKSTFSAEVQAEVVPLSTKKDADWEKRVFKDLPPGFLSKSDYLLQYGKALLISLVLRSKDYDQVTVSELTDLLRSHRCTLTAGDVYIPPDTSTAVSLWSGEVLAQLPYISEKVLVERCGEQGVGRLVSVLRHVRSVGFGSAHFEQTLDCCLDIVLRAGEGTPKTKSTVPSIKSEPKKAAVKSGAGRSKKGSAEKTVLSAFQDAIEASGKVKENNQQQ
jgi:hypothetical protein